MSGIMNMLVAAKTTVAAAVDEFFNRVTLLLNTSSTNGAQNNTFLDSSSNNFTITRNGNTTQGTFTPFSQTGWSNYFDGTGDYLTIADNAAFDIGASEFSIEAFVYPNGSVNSDYIFGQVTYSTAAGSYVLWVSSTGYPTFYSTTGGTTATRNDITSSTLLPLNSWSHICICRSGTTLSLFLNGTRVATQTYSSTIFNATNTVAIGADAVGNGPFNGYISNLRMLKGTSAYDATQSTLTVPTSALTAITNTSLLTCQSNRFIDNSTNAFTITRNGDTSVQAFSPFLPTAAYGTTTVGGSGYFDGTGDYLGGTVSAVNNTTMTIECWVYNTSLDNTNGNHYFQINNGSFANYALTHNANGVARFYSLNNTGTTIFDLQSSSGAIKLNQWQHIVGVRTSGNASLYVDGVRLATTASPTTSTISGTALYVGTNTATGRYLTGYISNSRVVSGTAVYDPTLSTLTVPTAPLTAITNTSLLLNYTNAGIFDAAAKNVLETVGNAQVSTTQAKFGTTSMAFDGTGDYLLTRVATPDLYAFGTGDFTIEFWLYANTVSPALQVIYDGRPGVITATAPTIYLSTSQLRYYFNGSDRITGSTLSINTWYHIALSRASGSTKLFVNGTQSGSTYTDSNTYTNTANRPSIGGDGSSLGTNVLNGYIDDLRITKGYARYTANFTAPTAEFPVQ